MLLNINFKVLHQQIEVSKSQTTFILRKISSTDCYPINETKFDVVYCL